MKLQSWQLPSFEGRYRVLAVDLRGHGRSQVMPTGNYTLADFVADIDALMTIHLRSEPCILVGHSLGGQIAARLAVERPQSVVGGVSVDGSLGVPAQIASLFAATVDELAAGDPATVGPRFLDLCYADLSDPALKRWHARRLQAMPAHVIRESLGPQCIGPDQVGTGQPSERFCRSIASPVFDLCRDPAQADQMRSWFSHPKSRVEMWANTGHWIMQDRPGGDFHAAVMAWIDHL